MKLLIPGRHHVLTDFQFKYLYSLIHSGLKGVKDVEGNEFSTEEQITSLIFAVTSANHSNTRRNPLSFDRRAMQIHDFCNDLDVDCFVYGIDDTGHMDDFASYTLQKIEHDSDHIIDFTPEDTIVVCSTPVMKMYQKLGYKILPAELKDINNWSYKTPMPWDIVSKIASIGIGWERDEYILEHMHIASYRLWKQYQFGKKVHMLFHDAIVGADGDLTESRDYNTYVRQMDEIAQMKYEDTASFVRPGRIGDIGCAVGSWIKLATEDSRLRESDFYGIEISRHLFEVCNQRKVNKEFANPFVFFAQKNAVTGLCFEPNSMNTIFTSSLTHEIESYGSHEDLMNFIANRYKELVSGGVWVNRDVVGPKEKDKVVYMKLNKEDGRKIDWEKDFDDRAELTTYLKGMSTYLRFKRFARDFRHHEGYKLKYEEVTIGYQEYVKLRLQDATEFLTKKDYVDNWNSEMHEMFCFWSFEDWKEALVKEGYKISGESKAIVNDWIVKNRWENCVELYCKNGIKLEKEPWPVTTMFLIAER